MVELAPTVIELGLNEAVAPGGRPLALSETACAEPLVTAEVMAVVPLWPWETVMLLGLELSEKSLPAVTVRLIDVVYVVEVPVPFTLMLYVPAGVDGDVEMDMVEAWPEATGLGLNDAVAPDGRPLALNATLCEEPLVIWVVTEVVALRPCITLTLPGLALTVK